MDYNEKKAIANAYLNKKAETTWDDLPDINSLHDGDTEAEIHMLCDERLNEAHFPYEDFNYYMDI